ncbi:tubulin binding cofactor c protein [Rutstroemia sp. NJR-2017a WRK4]|nr:tubulin binding cofactor c protein [Rutstroemia sp. NJR-2017a WRK4]
MAPGNGEYHPKDSIKAALNGLMITGSAGLLISSIQNTLTKRNVGALAVFTRTGSTALIFAAMGGTYEFTKNASANLREKDDSYNEAIGGFLAGSVLGLRFGTTPAVLGFGALTGVVLSAFSYTGGTLAGFRQDHTLDEFERKEFLRKNRRVPIEQTVAELGEGRAMATRAPISPFNAAVGSTSDLKERYYRWFQQEVTLVQEQISQLQNFSTGGERLDAVEYCLASITTLSKAVASATDFIPAYDQRAYSQAIKALSENLEEARSKIAPKARFRFKNTNKNGSGISINDAVELAVQKRLDADAKLSVASSTESSMATTPANLMTPSVDESAVDVVGDLPSFPKNYNKEMSSASGPVRKPSFSQANSINITGHTGLHIILPSSASRATSSGAVTKLDRCILDMSVPTINGAPFAGLALKNIKQSLILAGHVDGPAHITGVENSIIVVASRQVRMHECKNVDIYLHCASRPIIEDCSNIRFAPAPESHTIPGNSVQNQWDQVDDFKWLKAEHSPNWSVLPEEERLSDSIWTSVVPGGPGVGLDDILKKVGI